MRAGLSWLVPLLLLTPGSLIAGEPADAPPAAAPAAASDEPLAPEAREVLRACRDPIFIDCFKTWRPEEVRPRPPAPQPPPAPPRAPAPPPDDKKAEIKKPPPPRVPEKPKDMPDPDLPTFNALLRAIQDLGLQGSLHLSGPPKNGSVTLEAKVPTPPASERSAFPALTAPITDDER